MRVAKSHTLALLLLFCCLVLPLSSSASSNISDTDKYGWSETAGWHNFKPSHGGVTVNSDHLSGFVWAESIGWIKLGVDAGGPYANSSATDWGVNRDGSGNLTGYGWNEAAGWVNFNPTHSQVTIDPTTGDFDGFAWCEGIGFIHFNNANPAYKVQAIIDTDGDGVPDSSDQCPGSNDNDDADSDGVPDGCDSCPLDNPDDSDNDGYCDSDDTCPTDADKSEPGACGCNVPEVVTDADSDGTPDCLDSGDSDNDSFSDAAEVECGSDPLDPYSRCVKAMPWLPLLLDGG